MVLLIIHVFFFIQSLITGEEIVALPANNTTESVQLKNDADIIYDQLQGCLKKDAFTTAWEGAKKWNPSATMLAIADFSQSSDKQRFYIIDLEKKVVVLQTWVAHGKNSGDNFAVNFSNENSSHMSSKGFFMIGEEFISPKHGPSLVLNGLEKNLNDRARMREIIIHGADYVSEDFIEQHGRCGRSYGCPALPQEQMPTVISLLKPGSLLYIYS